NRCIPRTGSCPVGRRFLQRWILLAQHAAAQSGISLRPAPEKEISTLRLCATSTGSRISAGCSRGTPKNVHSLPGSGVLLWCAWDCAAIEERLFEAAEMTT